MKLFCSRHISFSRCLDSSCVLRNTWCYMLPLKEGGCDFSCRLRDRQDISLSLKKKVKHLIFCSNSKSYIRTSYILINLLVILRVYYPTHTQSQCFPYVKQGPVSEQWFLFPGSLLFHTLLGIVLPAIKSVVFNILDLRSCRNLPITKQVPLKNLTSVKHCIVYMNSWSPSLSFRTLRLWRRIFWFGGKVQGHHIVSEGILLAKSFSW